MSIFNFLLLISLIISIKSSNILEFNFKNNFSQNPNLNFLEQFVNNSIFIEFSLGTPSQKVPFQISFDESTSFILKSSNLFNNEKSTSYKSIEDKKNIWNERYENGIISNDSLKLPTNKKNQ